MEDKDIRRDPKVRQTLQDMGLAIDQIWAMGNGDLAFFMRDKCVEKYWYSHLFFLGEFRDAEDAIKHATLTQWIIAAAKAWDSKAADAAGDRQ